MRDSIFLQSDIYSKVYTREEYVKAYLNGCSFVAFTFVRSQNILLCSRYICQIQNMYHEHFSRNRKEKKPFLLKHSSNNAMICVISSISMSEGVTDTLRNDEILDVSHFTCCITFNNIQLMDVVYILLKLVLIHGNLPLGI